MAKMVRDEIISAIRAYEAQELSFEEAKARIFKLAGNTVDQAHLDDYWHSESIDDLAEWLAQPPIIDWESIDEGRALSLIAEALVDPGSGRFLRIADALERRFRKPEGFLSDLVFHREPLSPEHLYNELSQDTTIRL